MYLNNSSTTTRSTNAALYVYNQTDCIQIITGGNEFQGKT